MISTHILDLKTGLPAKDVSVKLSLKKGEHFAEVKTFKTNVDGRINFEISPEAGIYQLEFSTDEYFKAQGLDPFFTNAQINFQIKDLNRKYHVPLLLSPFGYNTYRGS
jgi:5-hydroxyisourate hydrolase